MLLCPRAALPARGWLTEFSALSLFVACQHAVLKHISGVPLLEKANMKAFGQLASYQQYLKVTPLLFPFVLPNLSIMPDRW